MKNSEPTSVRAKSSIGTIVELNGDNPAWQFDAQYSSGDRLIVGSRFIERAKPVQSLPIPVNCWSRLITCGIQYASVSTNTSCRSGKRSKTPPTIICDNDRPEKNECSIANVRIDAKPGGLYAGAPVPPC